MDPLELRGQVAFHRQKLQVIFMDSLRRQSFTVLVQSADHPATDDIPSLQFIDASIHQLLCLHSDAGRQSIGRRDA